MTQLTPDLVLREVAHAVPAACRAHIVIIGSVAAGYHFFRADAAAAVRTKDIDCVLEPYPQAVGAGQEIAGQLLDAGWTRRTKGQHAQPGSAATPIRQLPALRLYPPGADIESEEAWFIEFLTVPQSEDEIGRTWTRLPLDSGHFGLPSFRFLSLAAFKPLPAGDLGIRYARPEMMALANLLEHPEIKPDTMSAPFEGRDIKRSNKDLGRVLAIAILSDLDEYTPWIALWSQALETCFPNDRPNLIRRLGSGLRALLDRPIDLEEAQHTCIHGLLASRPPTLGALRAAGERVLGDVIEPMQERAARAS